MKLTSDNLDFMDCRPGGKPTGIKVSDRLEKLTAELERKRKAAASGEAHRFLHREPTN